MKKKSYQEHKQYCLEMKITSRQEWTVASNKDDFPKSLYKNVEKSFADKGEWISSEDFYFRETITKDFKKDESLLDIKIKQLFLAEKQYSELKLEKFDEFIYAYLMLDSFAFIRRDGFSIVKERLLRLFSKKYYKSCPEINSLGFYNRESIRPDSTNYYEEIISYDSDLLHAEREFLFYSNLYLNFNLDNCKKLLRFAYSDYFEDINFYLSSNNSDINVRDIQKTMDYFLNKNLNPISKEESRYGRSNKSIQEIGFRIRNTRYIDQDACDKYRENPDPKKIITKNPFKILFENFEKDKIISNSEYFNNEIEDISSNIGLRIHKKFLLSADKLKIEIDNIDEEDDIKRGLLLKYAGYLICFNNPGYGDKIKFKDFLNIPLRFFERKNGRVIMKNIEAFLKRRITSEENSHLDDIDYVEGKQNREADIFFNNPETLTERNCFRAVNHFKRYKLHTNLLTNDLFYNYLVIPAKKYFYDNIPPFLISKLKSIENSMEKDIGLIIWAAEGGIYEAINWDKPKHYYEHRSKIEVYGDIGLDENNNLLYEFDPQFGDFTESFGSIKKYRNDYENLESIESINAEEIFQIDKSLLNNHDNHSNNLMKSFKIYDQSMSPTFNEGDTVIINPQSENKDKLSVMELVSGRHYLIKKDSNYFARKIIIHEALKKDYILLKSTNADWPDTEVKFDEIEIIGQIIQLIKTVDT